MNGDDDHDDDVFDERGGGGGGEDAGYQMAMTVATSKGTVKLLQQKQETNAYKLKCHTAFQVRNGKVFAFRIQPYHFASTN